MSPEWSLRFFRIQHLVQALALAVFACAALGSVVATMLAAVGALPWLAIDARWGQASLDAGPAVQVALTVFFLALGAFLPASRRVMRLEESHRDFSMRMEDVARAYWVAHAADREGLFDMRREFDAVRERILFLRKHPDLEDLEPGLLELAAQMSHESRELADIYSDTKVARAREMLQLRRDEAEQMSERIARAHAVTDEIRRTLEAVEVEEDIARSRLERLRGELADLMPAVEGALRPAKGNAVRPRLRVAKGD